MKQLLVTFLVVLVMLFGHGTAVSQESHAHIGHVMSGWSDTPDGAGLLPTAQQEAAIALEHAQLAMTQTHDLDWIRQQSVAVSHALDPLTADGGPGLGYGLEQAALAVTAHVNMAAGAGDASDNVKRHAEHVGASMRNVATWSSEAMRLIRQIRSNDNTKHASIMAGNVQHLLRCVLNGCDANSDGTIDWGPGEGGLEQAHQHMTLMMQGEGMIE